MFPSKRNRGIAGEEQAVQFLTGKGYIIMERNYRCPEGEIDIIARHGEVLAFVEVRTRQNSGYGFPEESVTSLKQHRIIRCATWYLQQKKLWACNCRFDVVAIFRDRIEHITGAFDSTNG